MDCRRYHRIDRSGCGRAGMLLCIVDGHDVSLRAFGACRASVDRGGEGRCRHAHANESVWYGRYLLSQKNLWYSLINASTPLEEER